MVFVTEQGGWRSLQGLADQGAGCRRMGYMLALLGGAACLPVAWGQAQADDLTNSQTRNLAQGTVIQGDLYQKNGDLGLDGVTVNGTLHLDGGQAVFGRSGPGHNGTLVQSLAGAGNGVLDAGPDNHDIPMGPNRDVADPAQGELSIAAGKGETFSGSLTGTGTLSLLAGKQVLSGVNRIGGTLDIRNGTLILRDKGAIGPGGGRVGSVSVGLAQGNVAHMVMDGPGTAIWNNLVTVGNGAASYGQASETGRSDLVMRNGAWLSNGVIVIGNSQNGDMTVEGSSRAKTGVLYLGGDAPITGTLNVRGKGSGFAARAIYAGQGGQGDINVTDYGRFEAGNVMLGDSGPGTVTIGSGGTMLTEATRVGGSAAGAVRVETDGAFRNEGLDVANGTVTVGPGGNMLNEATVIGAGGRGVVLVDGGTFQSRNAIRFGLEGDNTHSDGVLEIRNHGLLLAGDDAAAGAAIATRPGARGSVSLDDALVRNIPGRNLTSTVATSLTGTTLFDVQGRDARMSWTGGFSGPGGLTKSGEGTLALEGTLAHTGLTGLQAGRLEITKARMAGDLASHGGTLAVLSSQVQSLTQSGGTGHVEASRMQAVDLSGGDLHLLDTAVAGDVRQENGTLTMDGVTVKGTLATSGGGFSVGSGDGGKTPGNAEIGSLAGTGDGILQGGGQGDASRAGVLSITGGKGDDYAGSLHGDGSLVLQSGRQGLSGHSQFSGGVVVHDGTLSLHGGGLLDGTGTGHLALGQAPGDKAHMVVDGAAMRNMGLVAVGGAGTGTLDVTRGGLVQGRETLIGGAGGPGHVSLTDGSTYRAGTGIRFDRDAQGGHSSFAIASRSVLSAGGAISEAAGSQARLILNGGTLQNHEGMDLADHVETFIGQEGGTFDVQGARSMTLDGSLADMAGADALSARSGGAGISKTGTGILAFNGDGDGFSGPVDVQEGEMLVDGRLSRSAFAVRQAATLAGTGTVGTTGIAAGGTLAPGGTAAVGDLHVAGDLVMARGSVLRIRGTGEETGRSLAEPDGFAYTGLKSDRVLVSGKAGLAGGTLDLHVRNPAALGYGQAYRVLEAAGGVSGHYDGLTTNLGSQYAYLDPRLVYQANDVDVVLRRSLRSFAVVAMSRNGIATGHGLDHVDQEGAFARSLVSLTREQAHRALDNLSGELHASLRTALIQDSFYVRHAVLNRLAGSDCAYGRNGQGVYDLHTRQKNGACSSGHAVLWGQAYGGLGHNGGDGNAALMHHNTAGFVMGVDTPLRGSNWRVGGLLSYGHSMAEIGGGRSSSANSNNITIGGYAGTHWGRLHLRLGATYGWNVINTRRQIAAGSYGGRVSSSYLGGTAQGFAELGYRLGTRRSVIEPFMNVAYVNMQSGSYHERGNDAALRSRGTDSGVTFSTFGFRASTRFNVGKMVFMPHVMGAYRHGFGRLAPQQHEMFASGTGGDGGMDVGGVLLSSNAAVIDTGLTASLTNRLDLDLSYIGQYGNQSTESGVTGSVRFRF